MRGACFKVMLHSTIRNDHFKRNAAWQHCYDIVANGCNIAPTLQRCVALKWLLRIVPCNITFKGIACFQATTDSARCQIKQLTGIYSNAQRFSMFQFLKE